MVGFIAVSHAMPPFITVTVSIQSTQRHSLSHRMHAAAELNMTVFMFRLTSRTWSTDEWLSGDGIGWTRNEI